MEIEMFFAKYDTDGNRTLEQEEVILMLADLEGQKVELESKWKLVSGCELNKVSRSRFSLAYNEKRKILDY